MKKPHSFFALLIIFALLLSTACSASDSYASNTYLSGEIAYDGIEHAPSLDTEIGRAPDFQVDTENTGKKIIYTARIALKTNNALSTMDMITQHTTELGGYLTDSSFVKTTDDQFGYVTVRIPPENLNELTHRIGSLGEIMDSDLSSEDVTERYVDINARLSNAQAQETQLLAIMERAETIEEILLVRSELHYVQQEIEQYKGTLRYLDNQVDYSTVTVHISEKSIPTLPDIDPEEGLYVRWTFSYIWANIVKGFRNSIAIVSYILGGILIAISYAIVPLIIVGAIILTIVLITKMNSKKKKNKTNATPADKTQNE